MDSKVNASPGTDSIAPRPAQQSWKTLFWQTVSFGAVIAVVLWMFHNINYHLAERGVQSGFAFLGQVARVPLSHSPIEFVPGVSTYATVLVAGAINSLQLTAVCIVAATLVGLVVGFGSLASNWLLARLCAVYVEALRNIPVLLQIFIWYQALNQLPSARSALEPIPHLYLSNRGLYLPWINANVSQSSAVFVLLVLLAAGFSLAYIWGSRTRVSKGRAGLTALSLIAFCAGLGYLASHSVLSYPELNGFDFSGGTYVSPEFLAVALGLTFYTAAFVAEIVRGGIRSVPKGQWEAAHALGLSNWAVLGKVVFPQALRPTVPALTNEYLGLLKNSSLAVAVGYQEIVSVGNTVTFETGQAVSVIFITMAFYLVLSLIMSFLMSRYHQRVMREK
ncbi:ABC transporter permease subunit [Caballeronia sp. LjRoot34]|uniref:amino acid ABC transporter permease n=1 Tax=Caballeronia sp. LjRoot34 TaxID=3342325 RepID=UPI003ECE72D3